MTILEDTALKWIQLLQTPHSLGFNINIFNEGNISRLPPFGASPLLAICNVKNNLVVHVKL